MITFVNVFTIRAGKQQDALAILQKVYLDVARHQPGFISAKLLVSDDGIKVTAIAQWESVSHLLALREQSGFKQLHNAEFSAAIKSSDGHIYNTTIEIPPPSA